MRSRDRGRVDQFNHVVTFVDKNQALFAKAPPTYVIQVQALRNAIETINQGSTDRGTGTVGQTMEQRRALREVLRVKHLAPLRQVAHVVGRTTAGMPKLVPVPKPAANLQRLLDVAKAVANDLKPYREAIVQRGFPEDFLEQLQQATVAVEQSHSANVMAKQRRQQAAGALRMGMQAAHDAVRCLDLVVRRLCDGEASAGSGPLAAWNAIVPPVRRGDRRVNLLVSGGAATTSVTDGGVA